MSRFLKGQSGNPLGSSKGRRGRPPGQKPSTVVIWDLKMAARKHCPKALQRQMPWSWMSEEAQEAEIMSFGVRED
jgi:hypothetical protein